VKPKQTVQQTNQANYSTFLCYSEMSGKGSKHASNKNGRNIKGKKGNFKSHSKGEPKKRQKVEIKFDPASRLDYIAGLSSRKKKRRAFGLAMQKVKDRQSRLEDRKEKRAAEMENIKERERQQDAYNNLHEESDNDDSDDNNSEIEKEISQNHVKDEHEVSNEGPTFDIICNKPVHKVPLAQGTDQKEENIQVTTALSELHGGKRVTITTTFGLPEQDGSDEEAEKTFQEQSQKRRRFDEQQRDAGNVKRYLKQMKGNLPQRKKKHHENAPVKRKGNHGASNMSGMGGAANLQAAKRTLMGAEKKLGRKQQQHPHGGGKGSKKGRR